MEDKNIHLLKSSGKLPCKSWSTENVVTETNADIKHHMQLTRNKMLTQYAEIFMSKVLQSIGVCNDYVLKEILIEGLL